MAISLPSISVRSHKPKSSLKTQHQEGEIFKKSIFIAVCVMLTMSIFSSLSFAALIGAKGLLVKPPEIKFMVEH